MLLQTEQLSTAQCIIENDLAVGFMFKNVAEKNPLLKAVPLSPSIHVQVSVIRKKDAFVSEGMKKLEHYLSEANIF